jgi:simple sugar transport system substrate-binding protein
MFQLKSQPRGFEMRMSLAAFVTAVVGVTAVLCSAPSQVRADDLTIGFIYVGPKDDYGYNQSHAEGAAAVKQMAGVKVLEEERVPETMEVEKTMESMINLDGANLLFPTSYGYFDPHILKMAIKYPDVQFLHCGGLYKEGMPKNVGSYFGYIFEAEYLSGIVAGHTTKTKKLGFIAAKPIPQVLENINAFELGARSVDPSVTTTVIFTGEWSMPVKEAEAAGTLMDQGVDVLTCHVDSPKVIMQQAEKRGIYCTGYHVDRAKGIPNRRRMELGKGLHRLCEYDQSRHARPAPSARRIKGRHRQMLAVWAGRLGRCQERCRRREGEIHGRLVCDFQGSAEGQHGRGNSQGWRAGSSDRSHTGKDELSGRRGKRVDERQIGAK